MAQSPQLSDVERRIPRQQRALESCEAIFEATAQIVQQGGVAALSTNRIAERAGVSIGTLYQYFPNKQAILLALGRREIATTREAVAAALAEAEAAGTAPGPLVVRALVRAFHQRRVLRRVLMETVLSQDLHAELAASVAETAGQLAARGPLLAVAAPEQRFVLIHAVLGVLRAVVLAENPPDSEALERELLALIRGYLMA
jgi:AcrR family transcriptional regulator